MTCDDCAWRQGEAERLAAEVGLLRAQVDTLRLELALAQRPRVTGDGWLRA